MAQEHCALHRSILRRRWLTGDAAMVYVQIARHSPRNYSCDGTAELCRMEFAFRS